MNLFNYETRKKFMNFHEWRGSKNTWNLDSECSSSVHRKVRMRANNLIFCIHLIHLSPESKVSPGRESTLFVQPRGVVLPHWNGWILLVKLSHMSTWERCHLLFWYTGTINRRIFAFRWRYSSIRTFYTEWTLSIYTLMTQ